MPPQTVSAAPIIDTSNSMSYYGYVAATVISSKAFMSYALPGDAIAVVNYDVNGNVCYGPNGAMAVVDSGLTQAVAASAAIGTLTFTGSCTNIGGGIQSAYTLLNGTSVTPKAAVLWSDGEQNCGTNPLSLPTTYPVYTCAMGPGSGPGQGMLQQVATRTSGLYYYMPYPVNMMQIYNQMRAAQPRVTGVVNFLSAMNATQQYQLIPATFSSASQLQQVGVVWSDPSYVYSNNSSPSGNQLYIVLYDPNGNVYSATPAVIGAGYVVFNVANPQTGTWNVYLQYAGSSPLTTTSGVFEYPVNASDAIRLQVTAPQSVRAGEKLHVAAAVRDGEEPVHVDSVQAEIVSPAISFKHALKKYASELESVRLPSQLQDGEENTPERRLRHLHAMQLPHHDIMPHRARAVPMARPDRGASEHKLEIFDTREGGSYNVKIDVTGYSKRSQTAFQRSELVTIRVED